MRDQPIVRCRFQDWLRGGVTVVVQEVKVLGWEMGGRVESQLCCWGTGVSRVVWVWVSDD